MVPHVAEFDGLVVAAIVALDEVELKRAVVACSVVQQLN